MATEATLFVGSLEDGTTDLSGQKQITFYKILDTASISPLYNILELGDPEVIGCTPDFEDVGRQTSLFPTDFTQGLAGIGKAQWDDVISRWDEDGGFQFYSEDLNDMLTALVDLSRKAIETDERLFIRIA